jgi:hypothetical protein
MRLPFTPARTLSARPQKLLERYIEQPFPTAEQALLCCFGMDLAGERSYKQLQVALLGAGFTGPLIRHLINASPIVFRAARNSYHLRGFDD